MKSLFKILNLIWIIYLIALYALGYSHENFWLGFVICIGLPLTLWYFYGSIFYFLNIPIKNFRSALKSKTNSFRVFAYFIGTPFALCSLSIIFLGYEFPGALIVYLFSVVTLIMVYIVFRFLIKKVDIDATDVDFVSKNLKILFLIILIILFSIIINWPANSIEFHWAKGTTNIFGM